MIRSSARFTADTVRSGHMLGQCGLRCMAPEDSAGRLAGTEHPPYGINTEPSTKGGLAADRLNVPANVPE